MSSHYLGDTIVKEVTFRDINGNLANPAVVNANAKNPLGQSIAGTETNLSVGKWAALYDGNVVGVWYYRVEGEGNNVDTVVEGSFCVRESSVE